MYERSRLGRSGRSADTLSTIMVFADDGDGHAPVREELPVDLVAPGRYRVLSTPGLAQGFAADDVIELDDQGAARVIERAGNVGVQIYIGEHDAAEIGRLIDAAEALGGWLDGYQPGRLVVLTVPVMAGFPAIEALVGDHVARTKSEWLFSNVYAEDGTTPLAWWGD